MLLAAQNVGDTQIGVIGAWAHNSESHASPYGKPKSPPVPDLKTQWHEARRFLERLEVFTLAESLGGVESLVDHPAIMTHASVPPEARAKLGISDSLVRLSVGIEDVEDLRDDLDAALKKVIR